MTSSLDLLHAALKHWATRILGDFSHVFLATFLLKTSGNPSHGCQFLASGRVRPPVPTPSTRHIHIRTHAPSSRKNNITINAEVYPGFYKGGGSRGWGRASMSGSRKSPRWVQGQSPGRGSGGRSLPEAEAKCEIFCIIFNVFM